MRAIELRQLRYFQLLAKELHFGRAAERAFVSQPALSQQIASLEERLGVQLFVRERRGVTLTSAGQVLLDGAEQILGLLERTVQQTRQAAEGHAFQISIGLVEYTNLAFVPPAMIKLQRLYPGIRILRHEMNGSQQVQALRSGQIDVGFGVALGSLEGTGVSGYTLLESGWALLMPEDHPLAAQDDVAVADLAGLSLIIFAPQINEPLYEAIVAQCRREGFTPNFVYETIQAQVGINLTAQGMGLMLGTPYVFNTPPAGLTYRRVRDMGALNVNVFWRTDENCTLVLDLVDLAKEESLRLGAPDAWLSN
ncbi:LysR substrate-binding domain-containing protein [Chitinimonas sp.]|uniref:LysR substrate-binding domain-containing protein n=1 Tax=Chitinimonas sp. TaxID=1934313 RepID=UPI002F95FCEE